MYNVSDIFHSIEGDDENELMTIPDEILEQMDWKEGDTIKTEVKNGALILSKVEYDEQ